MTLYDRVVDQLLAETCKDDDYRDRRAAVDDRLETMTALELLEILSYTFDWSHLKGKYE